MTQIFVRSEKTGLLVPLEQAQKEDQQMREQRVMISKARCWVGLVIWTLVVSTIWFVVTK